VDQLVLVLSLNGVDLGCMNPITGSTCRAKRSNILHDNKTDSGLLMLTLCCSGTLILLMIVVVVKSFLNRISYDGTKDKLLNLS
jgi:hypothetical protein